MIWMGVLLLILAVTNTIIWACLVVKIASSHPKAYRWLGSPSPLLMRTAFSINIRRLRRELDGDQDRIGYFLVALRMIEVSGFVVGIALVYMVLHL